MRNKYVISRLFEDNEEKLKELYFDYLAGNVKFGDELHDSLFFDMFYERHADRYKLRKEIYDEAAKSFTHQLKTDGEVKGYMFMMLLMMELITEFTNKSDPKKKKRLKQLTASEEKRNIFLKYLEELKLITIEEGVNYLPSHYLLDRYEVAEDPIRNLLKIKIDVTTSILFKILEDIHHKRLGDKEIMPYKNAKSLGQSIRHHKTSLTREGIKVYTYRRRSTHVVIEIFLSNEETKIFERENKRREWM